MEYQLVAIKVGHREDTAAKVQGILTEFGCNIKVRLGLHDLPSEACSPSGLIILQVEAEESVLQGFLVSLNKVDGVIAKTISL